MNRTDVNDLSVVLLDHNFSDFPCHEINTVQIRIDGHIPNAVFLKLSRGPRFAPAFSLRGMANS